VRIILAIDIIGGKCVRLTKGDYATMKTYNDNPLDVAKTLEENGIRYLHLVDLDGAREGKVVNHKILEEITSRTSLIVDFGGGIRSEDSLRLALDCGAAQVNIGSIAYSNREMFLEWLGKYGSEKIILAADSINRRIAVHGWSEESETDVVDFIAGYSKAGVRYVVSTDISRDGMMKGPSVGLYRDILSACDIKLIASGGISSVNDLKKLSGAGCDGAIIGKAYYEGAIKTEELKEIC